MKFSKLLRTWIPQLDYQVWILAAGRLLSQIGTGFTLFYLPIFFVNQVGLSATAVGIALGSASISGVVGRILGGSMADSHFWGRRRTLLLSATISAIASLAIAIANDFPMLVVGNLIMGLGVGLYWPATEAAVADLSGPQKRNEAYSVTRVADSVGLGLGVVLGGGLIAISGAYRALFVIDAISFMVFFGVVYALIKETSVSIQRSHQGAKAWMIALRDRRLLIYVLVNILITTYLAQVNSTLPLYFKNFVQNSQGFASLTISALFTWHLGLTVVCQLPIARALNRVSYPRALSISTVLWGVGFVLIWFTGVASTGSLIWAVVALGVLAIATATYTPVASSLVAGLAPEALRGVYLSVNSLCWAIGYSIGPFLGGIALDLPRPLADSYWLGLALSIIAGLLILQYLDFVLQQTKQSG